MKTFRHLVFASLTLAASLSLGQYQLRPFPKYVKQAPPKQIGVLTIPPVPMPVHAPGVQGPFAMVLKGAGYPYALRPSDLPAEFVAAKISSESAGALDSLTPLMMIGGMGSQGPSDPSLTILGALDLSWSRGDVTTVDGRNYLITYKAGLDLSEMGMLASQPNFQDTVLRLTLVRVDGIKSITPRPDMTKAEFQRLMLLKIVRPIPTSIGGTGR